MHIFPYSTPTPQERRKREVGKQHSREDIYPSSFVSVLLFHSGKVVTECCYNITSMQFIKAYGIFTWVTEGSLVVKSIEHRS